jgi:hypothetical protein
MPRNQVERLLGPPIKEWSDRFDYQSGQLRCWLDYDENQRVYWVSADQLELNGQPFILPGDVHQLGPLRQKLAEKLGEPDWRGPFGPVMCEGQIWANRYCSLKLQVSFSVSLSGNIELNSSFAKPPLPARASASPH